MFRGFLLGLLLFSCFGVLPEQGVTTDVINLGEFAPDVIGRQADKGVQWPGQWRVVRIVPVVLVQDEHGDLRWMDPEAVAEGKAALHRDLVANASYGTITSEKRMRRIVKAEVRDALRYALRKVATRYAHDLPADLAEYAPALFSSAIKVLLSLGGTLRSR